MNWQDGVRLACREPTIIKALSYIAVWECERVIPQAHRYLNKEIPCGSDGQGWDTCFEFLIKEVMEQYTVKRLKGL